jgi:hypothetical protein
MKPKQALYLAYALLYFIGIRSTIYVLGNDLKEHTTSSNTNQNSQETKAKINIEGREFYTVEYIHRHFVEHEEEEISDADFWLYSTIVMGRPLN